MDGAEGPCRTVHSPPGSRVASYFWLLHDRGDRRDRLLVLCFATTATSGGRMEHQTTETPKLGDSAGQRNLKADSEYDGPSKVLTAKTPAPTTPLQWPPRSNAPGPFGDPSPPKHTKSLPGRPSPVVELVQPVVFWSAQSATHSLTLPIMSNTPQLDLQFARLPVFDGPL